MATRRRRFTGRRRRRTRLQWFPTFSSAGNVGSLFDDFSGRLFQLNTSSGNESTTIISPLTIDAQSDTVGESLSLQEVMGQSWRLTRIVGSIFLARSVGGDDPAGVLVSAGIFVARQQDSDLEVDTFDSPIGADTNDRATFNYGPSHSSNISEPWVWRRSWILGRSTVAPSVVAPNALVESAFPSSNTFGYNAPNEGTHIDAKVGRRIRKEERLWFSIQAHPISMRESLNAPDTEFVCQVGGYLDIRILGTLVRNSKRSVF